MTMNENVLTDVYRLLLGYCNIQSSRMNAAHS
jgi:hypothetical protein